MRNLIPKTAKNVQFLLSIALHPAFYDKHDTILPSYRQGIFGISTQSTLIFERALFGFNFLIFPRISNFLLVNML